ncbi:unnamed protein product [Prorocentrum cordatum]|uniref:Uncharacterized protein n=1 Tax=Prorocentrum cordatum TaxID=2364126 RepID=A0ABN9TTQ4_9DINO|nr:unnamed protein product [Polarella glacialis]
MKHQMAVQGKPKAGQPNSDDKGPARQGQGGPSNAKISPPSSWTNEETTRARLTSNTFRRRVATSSNVTAAEIVEDTHASALPVSFLLLLLLLQLVGDELGT